MTHEERLARREKIRRMIQLESLIVETMQETTHSGSFVESARLIYVEYRQLKKELGSNYMTIGVPE